MTKLWETNLLLSHLHDEWGILCGAKGECVAIVYVGILLYTRIKEGEVDCLGDSCICEYTLYLQVCSIN